MTREEFIKQDKGGTIYSFPSASFNSNKDRGLKENKEYIRDSC
jgi:hypothetical protein